jgi:hypothetical protein
MVQARDTGRMSSLGEALALGLVRAVQPGLIVGVIATIVGGHVHQVTHSLLRAHQTGLSSVDAA